MNLEDRLETTSRGVWGWVRGSMAQVTIGNFLNYPAYAFTGWSADEVLAQRIRSNFMVLGGTGLVLTGMRQTVRYITKRDLTPLEERLCSVVYGVAFNYASFAKSGEHKLQVLVSTTLQLGVALALAPPSGKIQDYYREYHDPSQRELRKNDVVYPFRRMSPESAWLASAAYTASAYIVHRALAEILR